MYFQILGSDPNQTFWIRFESDAHIRIIFTALDPAYEYIYVYFRKVITIFFPFTHTISQSLSNFQKKIFLSLFQPTKNDL